MDSHILQVALTHLTKPIYGVNEKKKKKTIIPFKPHSLKSTFNLHGL